MEADLLIFETSTIHGYNPAFQDSGNNGRFDAFEMHAHHPRPERFHFENVPGTALLDHQGHIVPQNAFVPRLNHIATQLDIALQSGPIYDLAAANAWLVNNHPALHFQPVTTYIQNVLMAMGGATEIIFVDPNGRDLEERLGGYFSVINWNPVNISRAPSDAHRGNYPGNGPDNAVAIKLLTDQNNAGVTLPVQFAGFLQTHIADLAGNPDAFIAAGNQCLPAMPQGFYKFAWSNNLGPTL